MNKIKRAIDALKDVARAVKELVKAVLELAKETSTIFSKKTIDSGNPKAVVRYATNVADASATNTSLVYKVGWIFDVTLGSELNRVDLMGFSS